MKLKFHFNKIQYGWHHVSIIVDETYLANILVKNSMQTIFKQEIDYEIMLDIVTFNQKMPNMTIDYEKLLKQSSKSARGNYKNFI